MGIIEATIQVLREAEEPLPVKEITKLICNKGLWKSTGKTPEDSVRATLNSDIKKNGKTSAFIRLNPGVFGLRKTTRVPKSTKKTRPKVAASKDDKAHGKTYTFLDSAEKVLEKFGAKKPMHCRDITEKAIDNAWLITKGKTPIISMSAIIGTEIKRSKLRGEQPRFVHHGRGTFGLSKWMKQGLTLEIENHNKKIREKLHARLLNMNWAEFEDLVEGLLLEMGFEDANVTPHRKDHGIDVRGTLTVGDAIQIRMAIQVKKWKGNVHAPTVQQLRGSLGAHDQGLIITTSNFSSGARDEAVRQNTIPVSLIDGKKLVNLLIEHEIGIKRHSHDLLELDDEDSLIVKEKK